MPTLTWLLYLSDVVTLGKAIALTEPWPQQEPDQHTAPQCSPRPHLLPQELLGLQAVHMASICCLH